MNVKLSDFRIGNIINNDNTICAIGHNSVTCFGSTFSGLITFELHEIEPILLTDEELEKRGFIYVLGSFDKKDNRDFTLRRRNGAYYPVPLTSGDRFAPTLKYLHQLQNFYYAKTEQELIKQL